MKPAMMATEPTRTLAAMPARSGRCGDGVLRNDLQPNHPNYEECDDGNQTPSDACTNVCTVARCGDGIAQVGVEACDDGNSV